MDDQSSPYPRTYRYGWVMRAVTLIVCAMALPLATIFIYGGVEIYRQSVNVFKSALVISLGIYLLISAVYRVCLVLSGSLTLFADRLEYQGAFRRRVIYRDDIRACKIHGEIWSQVALSLYTKSKKPPSITLTNFGTRDKLFYGWISDLPTLIAAKTDALLENPAFGASIEQRQKAVTRDGVIIWIMSLACGAIFMWFIARYDFVKLAIELMVMPPLAVLLIILSNGRWQLTYEQISGKLSLIIFPWAASVPLLVSFYLFTPIDWIPPIITMLCLGILGIAGLACIERRIDLNFLICALWAFPYVIGLTTLLNTSFDKKPAPLVPFVVTGTDVEHGRIFLSHPVIAPNSTNIIAPIRLLKQVQPGQTLCVRVNAGALGWRWLKFVGDCPKPQIPEPHAIGSSSSN